MAQHRRVRHRRRPAGGRVEKITWVDADDAGTVEVPTQPPDASTWTRGARLQRIRNVNAEADSGGRCNASVVEASRGGVQSDHRVDWAAADEVTAARSHGQE